MILTDICDSSGDIRKTRNELPVIIWDDHLNSTNIRLIVYPPIFNILKLHIGKTSSKEFWTKYQTLIWDKHLGCTYVHTYGKSHLYRLVPHIKSIENAVGLRPACRADVCARSSGTRITHNWIKIWTWHNLDLTRYTWFTELHSEISDCLLLKNLRKWNSFLLIENSTSLIVVLKISDLYNACSYRRCS